jgi:hypothetical protein
MSASIPQLGGFIVYSGLELSLATNKVSEVSLDIELKITWYWVKNPIPRSSNDNINSLSCCVKVHSKALASTRIMLKAHKPEKIIIYFFN